ncbi:hypothetical protein P700755_000870 [Psychroflexus torquis ATCC 700755]|uniref:Uncharacterized protein n=1 Tax=Psychroflexus torquis (strain ATCC 700755 / CIP 106069 / ACAM 623) TaxID=313595 RepID=K4IBM8_PSYTT|nr:hypothetical protein P700755_000870 [Psychroflexus torquis ATCC 700755]
MKKLTYGKINKFTVSSALLLDTFSYLTIARKKTLEVTKFLLKSFFGVDPRIRFITKSLTMLASLSFFGLYCFEFVLFV